MDRAWAAGVLDARGRWLLIPRRLGGFSPRILVPVKLDADPMAEKLMAMFGGTVGKPKLYQRQWQVSGAKGCLAVDEAVLSHLVRRARVAKAHLHVCRRIAEFKRTSFEDRRLPEAELEARADLYRAFAKAEQESRF